MGKLINLLVGLFVALAGYLLTLVNEAVGAKAAQSPLPFDVTAILSYTSIFFLAIGGILIGYSVITGTYAIIVSIFSKGAKKKAEDSKDQRREEGDRERKEEKSRGQGERRDNNQRNNRETDYEKVRKKGNEENSPQKERFRKDSDDRERRS